MQSVSALSGPLPHSLEAERAVLGGILLDNRAMNIVSAILERDDFYRESHALVYDALAELFKSGKPMDTVTVREYLVARGKLQQAGGDEGLLELTHAIPTVAHIEAHARIVKDRALVRRMILTCCHIISRGHGDYGDATEFLDAAEREVFLVAKSAQRTRYEPIRDVVLRTFEAIRAAADRGERITGLPTGFHDLDAMTAGMHPGELIVVAGRPGMGKTAFALNVAVNACRLRGIGVGIFSLEMPKEQLVQRMLCAEAGVDGQRLRTGQLMHDDWKKLARAAGTLTQLPIFLDDTASLTIMELRAKTRRLHAESGLGLVVVDYLQLMRAGGRHDSREQEISEISRSLKSLAKELGIPVVALSQLNRNVEQRPEKNRRPMIADLRESGAIEQDADTILFVFREELYQRDNPELRNRAEIIVGKQRNGPTGTVHVAFFSELTRFDNLARDEWAPAA
ncbi:MAG: replicative DNA helicase [Myxococcota bacterium]|nr:replicative DNA helicase [Myxococcota bacterium]